MRNTHTSKQTSKRSMHIFAGFFGLFSKSLIKILLDGQIKEYNSKLSTTPNIYEDSQNKTNTTSAALQLQSLNHNHPLSLLPQNFRTIALTDLISSRPNYPQSPIQHIITRQSKIDDTYEEIIEKPHNTTFRSQNNHLFRPRLAAKLDHSFAQFPTQPTFKATSVYIVLFPNLITQISRPLTKFKATLYI